jgi:hypothetical protein
MFTFDVLTDLVSRTRCKPGWRFCLLEENGALRLVITVSGPNAANTTEMITISHFFPVPLASYNEKTWRRWMFERCRGVENHELGEWFKVDGEQPFGPMHAPGEDPYTIHEFRDDLDRRIVQDGSVRDAPDAPRITE